MFDYDDNNEESLRTRADRERVKDKRTREQKLLDKIFDAASSPEECKKSIELLKKETGQDRAGLVEKYTGGAETPKGGSQGGASGDMYQRMWSDELSRRTAAELKLRRAEDDLRRVKEELYQAKLTVMSAQGEWRVTERLLKSLACIVRGRDPRQEFDTIDDALELFEEMIEPIRQSFAKTKPSERSDQVAAIIELLADGPMTAGKIKSAVSKNPKLADLAEMTAVKLGFYLKELDGRVVGGMKLVGRRDAHRKQTIWVAEPVGG